MRSVFRSTLILVLATSALTPHVAAAVPATATAKVSAQYDMTVEGGAFVNPVTGSAFENVLTSVGDVTSAIFAIPGINCPGNNIFCIFSGTATAAVSATNGSVSVEAGVGAFSVNIVVPNAAQLSITGATFDTSAFTDLGDLPGSTASASAQIFGFALDAGPIFSLGQGDTELINLASGTHLLTWGGVHVEAAAERIVPEIPAPAALSLFGAALAALVRARRR